VRIALGTVQFGLPYGIANQTGQVARSEAKAMLQLAAANSIDTLDTAIAYGESETRLGEAGVQSFNVVTKLPAIPASCHDVNGWVREQVGLSLCRLDLTRVYGLLLHRSDDLLGNNGAMLWHALEELRDVDLVQKIGVSVYAPSEIEAVTSLYKVDLVQAPFNIVDRRLSTSGWLDRLKSKGVEVHTRSAFLQGLLLMSRTAIPPKFSSWNPLWDAWHDWLDNAEISAAQACLGFVQSVLGIDKIVVGVDSVQQLEQIIEAAQVAADLIFPEISCADERLINPSNWSLL
jgi:aryl-alcohol dehydrogenase-like predicted oxidoreductase